jgi:EAL domain-containing protein (putative c-di-GMP-specific phosphodiesterase class I)/ActR/RegA family two-component response regulator
MGMIGKPSAVVLEDDSRICEIVCRMLTACGFVARQFVDANVCLQALKSATAVAPAVFVLDLVLGQSDGVEVLRQLERLRYRGKVLLISASDENTLRDVQRIGVAHHFAMLPFLKKPFSIEQLKASLAAEPEIGPELQESIIGARPKPDLGRALTSNWLELWYQPKFDLRSAVIRSAEALLRLRHPQWGLMPPSEFLPPPGEAIYFPVSKFVVRQAMVDWTVHFSDLPQPPRLAVNAPLSVLVSPGFVDLVRSVLPTHPRFPGLIIEVTEDDVLHNPAQAREIATQLKLYNIHLSIDDFGAAYSAISRLRDLPAVEVKIHESFVRDCAADPARKALCQSIIELAHRFSIETCAEGVESPDDLRTLMALGCDTFQGYLLAKPQPAVRLRASLGLAASTAAAAE